VFVTLLICSSPELPAQNEIQRLLDEGRNLYYAARFAEAAKALSEADRRSTESNSRAEAVSAKVYLGATYYALRDIESARRAFSEICKIDPDYDVGTTEFSPTIVGLFQQEKQKCMSQMCDASCSSLRAAAQNREPDRIAKAAASIRQCGCQDARQAAAQAVLETALENYNKKEYALAQGQFQLALELNPAVRSSIPGLGRVAVTADGAGGRLFIDDEFKTDLKPGEPYESQPLPAGPHKLRLEPDSAAHSSIEQEITLEADTRIPIVLMPRPLAAAPRTATATADRRPTVQMANLPARVLLDLETGNQAGAGVDLMWVEIERIRYIVPQRGARLAVMPSSTAFERVTADELRRLKYTEGALGSRDQPVRAGMVFAVQTADGSLATVRIDSLGPSMMLRWMVYHR
jgi:tetratricopeptide (TPR) repeat protein